LSSNRLSRRIALLGLLALAGCGFAPVYGGGGNQGAFAFETDESVTGFRLQGRLSERLGLPDAPAFVIKTTVDLSERAAAITAEGDTARLNVIGSAKWSLVRIATGQQIDAGTVQGFTSYSATGSTVATQTAKDDAHARLAVILADLIVTRVMRAQSDLQP
jgi:LPS-assembly lipoprotein